MSNVTGSSGSPNFRIDVIFNSLRELQQEKERLQQHCNEEKGRCKALEMKLEACQAKCYQSSERNSKMLETVNAAKQKVLQTQMQASRLKELNDGKGVRIEELRKQIDEEMKNEQTELQVFEKQLAELTNNFRNARYYYTEENVKQEIELWSKQAEAAKAEVSKEDTVLKELSAKFHRLEMEKKEAKDEINGKLEFGLTLEELELALKVFEEMNQDVKEKLQISEQDLEQEMKRLDQVKTECRQGDLNASSPNEEQITLNETEATPRRVVPQKSLAPSDPAGSVHEIESNPNQEGDEHPTKENHPERYFRLGSPSVAPASKEETAHRPPLQSERSRKSSLQGRSFFISLPVTPSN